MPYNKNGIFRMAFAAVLFASASAPTFACQYLLTAPDVIKGQTNNDVCIDEPVDLKKENVVFNLDSAATTDGGSGTNWPPSGVNGTSFPIGLRHMWMLLSVNAKNIQEQALNPKNFNAIGVFHGPIAKWALSDAWWIAHGNPNGNPYKNWINLVMSFKQNVGINVQLEICGATMRGNGWTNADLLPGIKVNQGAIGRIMDLQENQHYSYIQEGFVDKD